MKYILAILSPFIFKMAHADGVIGTWRFTEYTYEGKTLPAPNPNLDLRFTFTPQGEAYLKWFRTDEKGFCQRKANYKIQGDMIWQKVVWLNPTNRTNCGDDPDMQIDHETHTKFSLGKDTLNLDIGLNGKSFIYILHAASGDASISGDVTVSADVSNSNY
jgi:hypothetical protein